MHTLLVHHDRQLLLLAVKHRMEVQRQRPVPRLLWQLVRQARRARGARIVDADIEAAQLLHRPRDGGLDGGGAGHVQRNGDDLDGREVLGERGGERIEGILVDVGNGEARGTVAGKVEGGGLADA